MPKGKYKRKKRGNYKKKPAKYRQQMLSIATVSAIAKRTCTKVSALNFKEQGGHQAQTIPHMLAHPSKQNGAGATPLVVKILDNDYLPIGSGQGQRISSSIYLEGFRIKLLIYPPVQNVREESRIGYCNVHWAVVRKNRINAPDMTQFKDNFWQDMTIVRRASKEKLQFIDSGVYEFKMNPRFGLAALVNGAFDRFTTTNGCRTLNKFIKIGKTVQMQDEIPGNLKQPYWLLVWTQCDKQGEGTDGSYCNDYNDAAVNYSGKFNAHCLHSYSIYYRDP